MIRIAVIGTGHLGKFHARLAKQSDQFELVGVVDPVELARRSLGEELGVASFADCSSVVGRIDAAVVATPTRFHHDVCADLLQQCVHVLVEKPITSTLAEAESLVALAARHERIFQVGHIERFNPAFAEIEPLVDSPKYIDARRLSGYTGRSTDIGVVLDLMVHDIDLVLALVKSPSTRVEAMGISMFGNHEDVATARVTFANGCVANLTASRVSFETAREMQIWSPILFAGLDFAQRTAKIVRPNEIVRHRRIDPAAMTPDQKQNLTERLFDDFLPLEELRADATNPLADEQADFAAAINTGNTPRVSGADGRDALALCESILSSIQQHAWDGHPGGRIGPFPTLADRPQTGNDAPLRRAG
jgi:predicted dehydrogenase